MKRVRITLLCLFTTVTSLVYCASNIGWGPFTNSTNTLDYGDSLIISTSLINYDTLDFNDTVRFSFKLNDTINVNPLIFKTSFINPLHIAAGGSIPGTITVIITPAYFLVGPDILVVW